MSRPHRIAEIVLLYGALGLLLFGFPDDQPFGLRDLVYWGAIVMLLATQPQGGEA